jgi:small subunit ribosomal protein S1
MKEVFMSENTTMGEMLEQYDSSEKLNRGDVVEGTVISSNADSVMVNINYMADGIVPKTEIPEENPLDYKEGDKVSVFVIKLDDGEGNVVLSISRAEALVIWDKLTEMMANKEKIELKIKEAVKGGVIGFYKTARIFIPASQLSLSFVEDLSTYAGKTLEVEIIEVDAEKKRAVASRKSILQEEADKNKAALLGQLKVGDVLKGTVARLTNFGAFVDLGGVDGLVHISQMSLRRINHPSEVVKVGEIVEVIVLKIDQEKDKISLKLESAAQDPWADIEDDYMAGDVVKGKVVRIAPFGAFIELEPGIEGLLHISEMADHHVATPSEVVNEGDEIDVTILSVDAAKKKISLTLKENAEVEPEYEMPEEVKKTTMQDLFGDKLKGLKLK